MRTIDAEGYFNWIIDIVGGENQSEYMSFRRLLTRLHELEFRYVIANDANRADDGINLRYRFSYSNGCVEAPSYLDNAPCSVLEMMVALAVGCEENIMSDTRYGNRTRQWFWGMIVNLGLGSQTDHNYDERYVDDRIETFLNRKYQPNGEGGLFTVRNCDRDLRNVEIWHQLCWYLDSIVA